MAMAVADGASVGATVGVVVGGVVGIGVVVGAAVALGVKVGRAVAVGVAGSRGGVHAGAGAGGLGTGVLSEATSGLAGPAHPASPINSPIRQSPRRQRAPAPERRWPGLC